MSGWFHRCSEWFESSLAEFLGSDKTMFSSCSAISDSSGLHFLPAFSSYKICHSYKNTCLTSWRIKWATSLLRFLKSLSDVSEAPTWLPFCLFAEYLSFALIRQNFSVIQLCFSALFGILHFPKNVLAKVLDFCLKQSHRPSSYILSLLISFLLKLCLFLLPLNSNFINIFLSCFSFCFEWSPLMFFVCIFFPSFRLG